MTCLFYFWKQIKAAGSSSRLYGGLDINCNLKEMISYCRRGSMRGWGWGIVMQKKDIFLGYPRKQRSSFFFDFSFFIYLFYFLLFLITTE